MKRLRITHQTTYHYHSPVTFGPHRALVRPREGHDVHIESSRLQISPVSGTRWLRDIYGNSIAIITFSESAQMLSIFSEVVVAHYNENPVDFLIDPSALNYPFHYAPDEEADLVPYRLSSYPHDSMGLHEWLAPLYTPGHLVNTFDLLSSLNHRIYESFRYVPRDEHGVQTPAQTLSLGSGSCRDYAVLMMEGARHWGFGARFVSGYVQLQEGQHGSTHAWTEIYIPGAGWRGFDPTNNKMTGSQHVSVAVARDPDKASPLSGTWKGPRGAFASMEVKVSVVAT